MVRRVRVVPHEPSWSQEFREEADQIKAILGEHVVAVYHIGSTAIPNTSAKPIIDLLVAVHDIQAIDALNPEMACRGYYPKGENGISGRRYFVQGSEEVHTHHVHIFQVGNPQVRRHLDFRDYLRAHPQEAQAYGRLKEKLGRAFPEDIESYMLGKDAFIQEVDRKASLWRGQSWSTDSAAPEAVPGVGKLDEQ